MTERATEQARVHLVALVQLCSRLTQTAHLVGASPTFFADTQPAKPLERFLYRAFGMWMLFSLSAGVLAVLLVAFGSSIGGPDAVPNLRRGMAVGMSAGFGVSLVVLLALRLTQTLQSMPKPRPADRFSGVTHRKTEEELWLFAGRIRAVHDSATEFAMELLTYPLRASDLDAEAIRLAGDLLDANRALYRLAVIRDTIELRTLVEGGRRRLVPMKAASLGLREISDEFRTLGLDDLSLSPAKETDVAMLWTRIEAHKLDAQETIRDHRWSLAIAAGGFIWTGVVALVTWAVTQ